MANGVTLIFEPRTVGILAVRKKEEHYELIRLQIKPGGPYFGGWDLLCTLKKNPIVGHLFCDLTETQISVAVKAALGLIKEMK